MSKDRTVAFFDATLAIIMTILVLDLEPPQSVNIQSLWDMRMNFFAYALSFFWLGTMWIHQVQAWSRAEYVNNACLWWTLILLFCSSLIPFSTNFVAEDYTSPIAEVFYILNTIAVTWANLQLNHAMLEANPDNSDLALIYHERKRWLRIDLCIKCVGLLLAFLAPGWALLPILLALIYIIAARRIGKSVDRLLVSLRQPKSKS